jgi:hypothetical protein
MPRRMALPSRSRWLVVGLAIVAAAAFAISVQAGKWWALDDFEIGPFGSRNCLGGECHPTGLGWAGGTDLWMRTGMATWAGGLLAMLALLVVGAGTAAGRIPQLAARTSIVAIATATAAGIAFFLGLPEIGPVHIDRGLFLFVGGVIAGSVAAIIVLRGYREMIKKK